MVLSAAGLLTTWEVGATQHPVQRALTLLAAAWSEMPSAAFFQMSIGQRDAYLLNLRERLFGDQLTGVAKCPQCTEWLELRFLVADIRAPIPATDDDAAILDQASRTFRLTADGYKVGFRLPNSADLLAVVASEDAEMARLLLLKRCVGSVEKDGKDATEAVLANLPDGLAQALVAQMDQADPQGNVQLALNCPACGHRWLQAFDILTYLWSEIDDWAQRTLREVHRLASAYGWSEQEILCLSARRRQLYLEMELG